MRRIWAIAAFAALVVAGCTGSSGGDPSSPAPTTSARPSGTPPSTSVTAPSSPPRTSVSAPGPPHPTRPHVPADVPRTGPNTKPGEKPPIEPLEATQHTPRGAKAFAAFFIKTIDWGYATMSSNYIRHYTDASCVGCAPLVNSIDKDRHEGHQYVGGRITVTPRVHLRSHPRQGAEQTVYVSFNVVSFEELNRKGKPITVDAPHTGEQFEVSVRWRGTGWRVTDLRAIA